MKTIGKILAPVLGVLVWASCQNAEYSQLVNQAYILQTETNACAASKITLGNEDVTTSLNVRLSDPAQNDWTFRLVPDAEAINAYNKKYTAEYSVLPDNLYSLENQDVKVVKGSSLSTQMSLTVHPLTEELKNSGKKFALGFRVENVASEAEILESGKYMVLIFDQVIIQPVVVLNSSHYIEEIQLAEAVSLPEWTVEFNINKDQLRTEVGKGNNQALFGAYADGSEIYVRFGDAPIEGNRLQIKTQGTQINSNMLFNTNTWYHIAVVSNNSKLYIYVNGALDNSIDLPGTGNSMTCYSTYTGNGYHLGNSIYSELRLWNKARSQAEIQNNMYACDPASPGLVFYYKFNEGEGSTFHDASGHGYDVTLSSEPTWIQDVRIDGK
ncbi:MAG: DUF1735 and LamG domain-containing protein [Candidatus Cryptobacteroides sp.]